MSEREIKIGQKVFFMDRNSLWRIRKAEIIKEYPNTNRWRIKINNTSFFSKMEEEYRFSERFAYNYEIFLTHEEALNKAIEIFDDKIKGIIERKNKFISENKEEEGSCENTGVKQ